MSLFQATHFESINRGLILYNDELYWECHEELENHWLEESGDDVRYIYWTIIQVAAALLHYENNNLGSALSLINKAKEKVTKCESTQVEGPYLEEVLEWNKFKKLIKDISENDLVVGFKNLKSFKFNSVAKHE